MTLHPSRTAVSRRRAIAALAVGLTLTATACGGGDDESSAASTATAPVGAVDLSGVCPKTVVIQTDWNPQSEAGGLYQLLGPDPQIDAQNKRVRGPLYASGAPTGVDVEVRSGGPAIGFQSVPTQMYTDPDILLGWVNTDEAVQNSAKMPTTAVFATFDKAPWMIMWDPATYPDAKTIADLGKTKAVVRYFDGATYMDYLVGSGQLRKDQIDGSYDGTPANFLAAGGKDAQQGFVTDEVYVYENELEGWKKPVAYQLVADTGYPLYAVALSTRTGDLAKNSPCLKKLIPVVQRATADYFASPAATNALIVKAVQEFDTGWVYSPALADDSAAKQLDLGLVSNGDNGTLGDFDETRVKTILDITTPIFTRNGTTPRAGLAPSDLFTNEFLDPSIGLG